MLGLGIMTEVPFDKDVFIGPARCQGRYGLSLVGWDRYIADVGVVEGDKEQKSPVLLVKNPFCHPKPDHSPSQLGSFAKVQSLLDSCFSQNNTSTTSQHE